MCRRRFGFEYESPDQQRHNYPIMCDSTTSFIDVFIEGGDRDSALAWAVTIADEFMRYIYDDYAATWRDAGYQWEFVESADEEAGRADVSIGDAVSIGDMPDFDSWVAKHRITCCDGRLRRFVGVALVWSLTEENCWTCAHEGETLRLERWSGDDWDRQGKEAVRVTRRSLGLTPGGEPPQPFPMYTLYAREGFAHIADGWPQMWYVHP
jgi:hypothetical protein